MFTFEEVQCIQNILIESEFHEATRKHLPYMRPRCLNLELTSKFQLSAGYGFFHIQRLLS